MGKDHLAGLVEGVIVCSLGWALFTITILFSSPNPDIPADRLLLACILGSTPPVLWAVARIFHFIFIKRARP